MEDQKAQKNVQHILAISGVKNSGKTTLITKLLPELKKRGLKVAVIKHDGHDFQPDVPDTDSWKYAAAGACGTCVFSDQKHMLIKYMPAPSTDELIRAFPEADVVLLEGFKYSDFPKVEVIRKDNSFGSVCDPANLWGIVSDYTLEELEPNLSQIPFFGLEEITRLADYMTEKWSDKEG